MDTLLFNDPEVKGLAFAILEEPTTDLQARGAGALANAAMSAKADEVCKRPYGERRGARQLAQRLPGRGLSTAAGDVTLKMEGAEARVSSRT